MGDGTKWLLLGGAALLIYEWMQGGTTAAAAPATTATGTPTPSGSTVTTTTAAPKHAANAPLSYLSQLNTLALSSKGGWPASAVSANVNTGSTPLLTPDEWAYYYTQITGESSAPSVQDINAACPKGSSACGGQMSDSGQYTASDWLGAMQAGGLSGMGRNALGTLQVYRGVRDRLARAFANQNGMRGLGQVNQGVIYRNNVPGRPINSPKGQHVINKMYWEGRRGSRQLPYRWVN